MHWKSTLRPDIYSQRLCSQGQTRTSRNLGLISSTWGPNKSPPAVHIHQNASLLVEPKVVGLPGLRWILQRKAELLQSEENELMYLAEGNLQSLTLVNVCSWYWHPPEGLLTFLPMQVLVPAPNIKLCLFMAEAFSPSHLLGWKVWASGPYTSSSYPTTAAFMPMLYPAGMCLPATSSPPAGVIRGIVRPTLGCRRIASLIVAHRNGSSDASRKVGGELSCPEVVASSISSMSSAYTSGFFMRW